MGTLLCAVTHGLRAAVATAAICVILTGQPTARCCSQAVEHMSCSTSMLQMANRCDMQHGPSTFRDRGNGALCNSAGACCATRYLLEQAASSKRANAFCKCCCMSKHTNGRPPQDGYTPHSLLQVQQNQRDTAWASYTNMLGFSVMGIWPKYADGTDVNAVCR